jgi:hypothetical protein
MVFVNLLHILYFLNTYCILLFDQYIDPSKLPWGAKDQDVDPELDILINQRLSKF